MFKVEAAKTPSGNWNLQASCAKGHTVYKKQGDSGSAYKCPYCGEEVY